MLYLEQPVQVGLSYDTLANFTVDLSSGNVTALNEDEPIPEQNATFLVGTYPSRNRNNTAQGTRNAAISLWHFAQVWFQEFPGYHPNDSRISIATESCTSNPTLFVLLWAKYLHRSSEYQVPVLPRPDPIASQMAADTAPASPPSSRSKTKRSSTARRTAAVVPPPPPPPRASSTSSTSTRCS